MSSRPSPVRSPNRLASYYRQGDALRSRSVSDVVLRGTLDVPTPPVRLVADWEREVAERLGLEPGDVEPLPLPRARARWSAYGSCVAAVSAWTRSLGLDDVLSTSDVALMACRGARYHHDGAQYGAAAFCNLFLSDDRGLDVHFPVSGHRIPLVRGTALIFDTGQPHAVVERGANAFDAADFAPDRDRTQVFLTWELPIENARVAAALGIAFDIDVATASRLDEEQVWLDGAAVRACPNTGRWLAVD